MSLKRRSIGFQSTKIQIYSLVWVIVIIIMISLRVFIHAFHQRTAFHLPSHRQGYNSIFIRLLSQKSPMDTSSSSLSALNQDMKQNPQSSTNNGFFAEEKTFEDIGIQSHILIERLQNYLLSIKSSSTTILPRPTAVQAASYKIIQSRQDVTIGAETGSGKTLAYLLPLMDDILQKKRHLIHQNENMSTEIHPEQQQVEPMDIYTYARAMILVPNKELANQVLRMAIPLCGGRSSVIWNGGESTTTTTTSHCNIEEEEDISMNHPSTSNLTSSSSSHIIRLGIVPGNLNAPEDYKPFRMTIQDPIQHPPLDIIITTPASIDRWGLNPKFIDFFADIQTLVIDEADMLFDGGFIRSLENVLLGFKRADRLDYSSYGIHRTQYILVAATVPDMGLKSVYAYIQKKFPRATRITMNGMHNARHYGLEYKTLWIEDETTTLVEDNNFKRKRMEKLIRLLKQEHQQHQQQQPLEGSMEGQHVERILEYQGLKDEKVMIFLNSAEDVDAVTKALIRANIPAVPYHAKIPLVDRVRYLDQFRRYIKGENKALSTIEKNKSESTIPIMVCTDLASRGLDIPDVTAVVQLQFAGNVVAHLHRMGRCGRAGNRNGRGIIFYGKQERELVSVIQDAERQQDRMTLQGDVSSDFDLPEDDVIDHVATDVGKIDEAFSRKRGFTKKRKKLEKKDIA